MKTVKERIEDLFELTDKKEIAKEIDILLDDFASTIMVRLEREFCFYVMTGEILGSSCYVSPPAIGEQIIINEGLYIVISVTHTLKSRESGSITLQRAL